MFGSSDALRPFDTFAIAGAALSFSAKNSIKKQIVKLRIARRNIQLTALKGSQ